VSYARAQAGNNVPVCSSAFDVVDLRILRGGNKAKSKITTPGFRRAGFGLLSYLLARIPQEMSLERRVVKESWLIFKDHLLPAPEWSTPMSRISSKGSRRPAWTNKELLTKLKWKKEVCKRCK